MSRHLEKSFYVGPIEYNLYGWDANDNYELIGIDSRNGNQNRQIFTGTQATDQYNKFMENAVDNMNRQFGKSFGQPSSWNPNEPSSPYLSEPSKSKFIKGGDATWLEKRVREITSIVSI